MKKIIVLTLAIGIGVLGLSACGKPKQASSTVETLKTVKIGTPSATGNMGGIAGLSDINSYLDDELKKIGYQSEIVGFAGAGPAVNEALIGGSIDFAVLADFPALTAKSKGVDTKLIAIESSLSNCAIAVRPDSEYKSITDLKGKKIALPKGTYMQRFFILLIKEKGLTEADFEIVQMTNDMESALVSGAVDAIIFTDSTINKIVYAKKTARIIETTKDYPDYSGQSVVVGRTEFLKQNPDVAVAILNAFTLAREYAKENPEKAAELLAEKESNIAEAVEATYEFKNPNSYENFKFILTDNAKEKLERTKSFLLESKFIAKDFDIAEWYDKTAYEKSIASK